MKKTIYIAATFAIAACSNQQANNTAEEQHQHMHDSAMHENHEQDTTAIKAGQKVFFKNISDGQEIKLPFVVEFGVEGMEVEPASVANPDKGHHHLIVDNGAVPANTMVPMGNEAGGYYHFGKGQTSDTLNIKKYPMLTKGTHTLRLQFANGMHMSYGPAMSAEVKITVK